MSDLETVANRFQPEQLTRAREMRAMTKTDLADKIGRSPAMLSQYEAGTSGVSPEIVVKLSMALNVPVEFFGRKPLTKRISLEDGFFRSMRAATQRERRKVLAEGQNVLEVMELLEARGVEFPEEQITPLKSTARTPEQIEKLAEEVRAAWGLGLEPVTHPISLLESRGVRILPIRQNLEEVDAFSCWMRGKPVVFLAMSKSSSRTHFDAAHELGHLLLHEDVRQADPEQERQADRFAGAFLMPRKKMSEQFPESWDEMVFRHLKRKWRVAIQALIYRAHELGCISDSTKQYSYRVISSKGWRKNEPDEWKLERPKALQKALEAVNDFFDLDDIAERLGFREGYLEDLLHKVYAPDGDTESFDEKYTSTTLSQEPGQVEAVPDHD